MPVDVTSRYWRLKSFEVSDTDLGKTSALPTRLRRPAQPLSGEVYNHQVSGVETIESIAFRFFGKSTAWWVVADTNELAHPLDYRPGATIKIPPAAGVGQVARTRSF
jgi:hypothetical protein